MKFFIDFEATQPENEIISIGIICENGNSFKSLIKPCMGMVSPFVSKLTGIKPEELKTARTADFVFEDLYNWIEEQEINFGDTERAKRQFYTYGNSDINFLRTTLSTLTFEFAYNMVCSIIANLNDFSKKTESYFERQISLINAYNSISKSDNEQTHDPLIDAMMLQALYNEINDKQEKFNGKIVSNRKPYNEPQMGEMPHGRFYCKGTGKNAKEREFASIEDAIEWIIETECSKNDRDRISRKKMAVKIMKAIKSNTTYHRRYWRREK